MKTNKNWQRYALQWGALGAIILFLTGIIKTGAKHDPEAYCPFGGLQALARYVSQGSLPCDMSSTQIIFGIALVVAVVLLSKLFCAYLCPLGTVSDLLIKLRGYLNISPLVVPTRGVFDKILRIVKYLLLFWVVYNTMATGELFCKKIDPYYAVATGFKGELVFWTSAGMLALLAIASFFIDNFWCRYICPLGALSNTLKYWLWMITLMGVVSVAFFIAKEIPVWSIIALFCGTGYLFEIFSSRTSMQAIYIQRNEERCRHCMSCEKKCPYHLPVTRFDGGVEDVDCMLCGECVANCPSAALYVGYSKKRTSGRWNRSIPALLTIAIVVASSLAAMKYEFPTINERWESNSTDVTFTIEGLKQVRCYASSMAFMKRLQGIDGVHGVKTFVKHHKATILYSPDITNPDIIRRELFVETCFQISPPDYHSVPELRVITIRADKLSRHNDLNLLGLQFKQRDSLVYGLETKWDMPPIVRMFVHPSFDRDEDWIRDIVNMPVLELKNAQTGKITQMQLGFEYIRMDLPDSTMRTIDFLHKMFKPFNADITPMSEVDPSLEQLAYIIPEKNVPKPMFQKDLPLLVSYLSVHEGVGAVYSCLDDNCEPSLGIRFFHPMTGDKLHALLSAEEWTVRDKEGLRVIQAPLKYSEKGKIRKLPHTPGQSMK